MTDRHLSLREAENELEPLYSEDELSEYLEELAPYVGWIIIYFNSLEDGVSHCIRETILHDPYQDERMDVFLSEMMFSGKCRSLMHLYGQLIQTGQVKFKQQDLVALENKLLECSRRRNEYAHADWVGIKEGRYVRVKSQSKREGIVHRYRKFELSRIQNDVDFICQARDELDEFHERINDQLWGRE
ncbi:hypothetical protein ACFW0H_06690 [Pseudomonas sp. CR3202]|uniref:hypothetical protein n=1 Tax=Pseudomonas sp. CR3202 TaxID=3351532 RepID=UPI003BF08AD1